MRVREQSFLFVRRFLFREMYIVLIKDVDHSYLYLTFSIYVEIVKVVGSSDQQ